MGNSIDKGQKWVAEHVPDLAGQVFVITGCSSGIGAEAARILAARNAHVVMANRSEQKTSELLAVWAKESPDLPQDRLEFVPLDLADLESVDGGSAEILRRHPKIDVLICNAGVMAIPLARTKQGHEMQFGTNMLGHYYLINQLMPALKANAPKSARVTLLSSLAHTSAKAIDLSNLDCAKGYSEWGRYAETKLGDLLIMTDLKRRLEAEGSHVTVTGCHPGYSATNLQTGTSWQKFNGILAQSAFMGALPTLMAATDGALPSGSYVGPGRMQTWGRPAAGQPTAAAQDQRHAQEVCEVMDGLLKRRGQPEAGL